MKKLIALLLAATMAFSLAACGGGSSSGEAAAEPAAEAAAPAESAEAAPAQASAEGGVPAAHLNIWLAGNGELETSEAFHKIFDNWVAENSPGSTYELTFVAWSDYFTKLSTALASGEGPDIFMTGYGQLGTIVSQGHTVNLSEKIPADWDGYTDIPENLLAAGMKDGSIYGILEPATRLYYYRKDIAEQNGVTEEDLTLDSLDDLAELAKKMTVYDDKGNVVISGFHVFNEPSIESIEQMVQSVALNYDGGFHMWNADGTANFNCEAGVKAIDWMRTQLAEGYNFPAEQGFDQFSNGLTSMYLMAESTYATYANTFPDNVGIVKSNLNTLLIGNFITVNAGSKNIDTAVDCLMYMFNEESLKIKAGLGMFPNRQSLYGWYAETYPELAEVPNYFEHSYAYSDTLIPFFTQGVQVFRNAAGEALKEGADIQAALDAGAAEWDALKAQ